MKFSETPLKVTKFDLCGATLKTLHINENKLFILIVCLSVTLSCEYNDLTTCGAINPVEELDWLAEAIVDMNSNEYFSQYEYLKQANYRGETVFIFYNCNASGNYFFFVYNCTGAKIGLLGSEGYLEYPSIDPSEIVDSYVIWRGKNFECPV